MSVQEAKKVLRVGVFRGKQRLEERVIKTRSSVYIGKACKENDECQIFVPSAGVPDSWDLFAYDASHDRYRLHIKKSMKGRVVVKNGVSITIDDQLKASALVDIHGDDVFISLGSASRGRVVIGKITFLFQFVVNRDENAVARLIYKDSTSGKKRLVELFTSVAGIAFIFSLLVHLVPLLYIGLQDWPRDDETIVIPAWFKAAQLGEMQIEKEEEPEEIPEIVEETQDALPSEVREVASEPDPGTVSRSELMNQITDKHREQGAMITAQILGVEGGVEGFYADMLGSNTHIADMSDISAGDIGAGASGNLLNQLAGGDGGAGGGLLGLDSGSGAGSAPKVVVDSNAKKTTNRAKVSFKMTDKSDFAGAPPPGSKEAIEGMFRKKQGDIKSCYQRVMNAQGKAAGRFVITITVLKDGAVLKVDKAEDQIGGEMFQCVRQRIMNWKFGQLKAPITFRKTWVFS